MRQFFSWRVWAALGAVIALALLWRAAAPDGGVAGTGPSGPPARTVQFVALVYSVSATPGFGISDGVVTGAADLVIDGQRTMHIVAGTPGEIDCPDLAEIGRCVVLADLLGEAVVWFTLQPVQTGLKVEAPPIVELLEDGIARLENGWLVRYDSSVTRKCNRETESLSEFISDHGTGSRTVIDVGTQRITQVVCANATPDATTTSVAPVFTTLPESGVPGDATSTLPGEITEEVPVDPLEGAEQTTTP